MMFSREAVNTLNAGWLEIKLARLFGKKKTYTENKVTVIISKWRGKYYLIDCNRG